MQTKDVVPVLLSPITKTFGFAESMVVLGYAIANKIKRKNYKCENGAHRRHDGLFGFPVEVVWRQQILCLCLGLKPLMAGGLYSGAPQSFECRFPNVFAMPCGLLALCRSKSHTIGISNPLEDDGDQAQPSKILGQVI
jgi:hypothetical protein